MVSNPTPTGEDEDEDEDEDEEKKIDVGGLTGVKVDDGMKVPTSTPRFIAPSPPLKPRESLPASAKP
ncbi:hypothetical protein FQZ97_1036450 [compost metagenome]